ncbi:MAG: response regulator transcription factor [Acidimicrobiales bacterium]
MSRLLLVEDDAAIAEPLGQALRRDGYDVAVAADGETALARMAATTFDIVILDLGLPGMDGVDLCRRIRSRTPDLPVLMLTARTEELDAVVGLDAGADDYVTKPFRLAELLARVRAQLRRRGESSMTVQELRVDPASRRATLGAEELALTPKEFDLLALLAREAGTVVTRERIMGDVWDEHWFGSTKTLDVHVSSLRRKLHDDPADPRFVTTIRGVGLRLEKG